MTAFAYSDPNKLQNAVPLPAPNALLMQIWTFLGPESEMSINNPALNYISHTEHPIHKQQVKMAVMQT